MLTLSAAPFPHPFSGAHGTAVFKERDIFPVRQSHRGRASHAYPRGVLSAPRAPVTFLRPDRRCKFSVCSRVSRWTFPVVGVTGLGLPARQRSREPSVWWWRKRERFPAWRPRRKPSGPAARPRPAERPAPARPPARPQPEALPQGISHGLSSTKHNTNVGLSDLSSSAPIYFTRNTLTLSRGCCFGFYWVFFVFFFWSPR